jgi:predicted nucleotidyltransferase
MTTFINVSTKIDSLTAQLFSTICECATKLEIPYLVIGATARDLFLYLGHGVRIDRATTDIDFGIQVSGWDQFYSLRSALLTKGFQSKSKTEYRLNHPAAPVDLIPFGDVLEDENAIVHWPPSGELAMNVLGFQDAIANCELVRVQEQPIVDVPVATPSGISILKTIAWTDRSSDKRVKDAQDLVYLCDTYEKMPSVLDRVFQEENTAILERFNYDSKLVGAHLLGVDASLICSMPASDYIQEFFESKLSLSLEQMIEESCVYAEHEFDRNESLIEAYRDGYMGIAP